MIIPRVHVIDGIERLMGCLPRVTRPGDGEFPIFGEAAETPPLIPRDRLPDRLSMRHHVWHVIDQSTQGSCCACMTGELAMAARRMAGFKDVVLSQASVYGPGNGGRDQGMAIDTGLQLLRDQGACPVDVIDQYDWQGYWNGTWPADWRETAAKFRVTEAYDLPTVDHLLSAMKHGFFVGFGVFWEGGGGHAIEGSGFTRRGSSFTFDGPNSWGKTWNGDGFWRDMPESQVAEGLRYFGGWATRVMVLPSGEDAPPAAA